MRYVKPFRVGRKQKRAVLDGEGKEVIAFHKGDEAMAEAYCSFLNGSSKNKAETYLEDDDWVITYTSGQEGKLFVGWENSLGECSAELLTLDELYDKYPWIQRQRMRKELEEQGLNVDVKLPILGKIYKDESSS